MATALKFNDPRLMEWQIDALNMTDAERADYAEHLRKIARMILRNACVGCVMVSEECPNRCARAEAMREN